MSDRVRAATSALMSEMHKQLQRIPIEQWSAIRAWVITDAETARGVVEVLHESFGEGLELAIRHLHLTVSAANDLRRAALLPMWCWPASSEELALRVHLDEEADGQMRVTLVLAWPRYEERQLREQ